MTVNPAQIIAETLGRHSMFDHESGDLYTCICGFEFFTDSGAGVVHEAHLAAEILDGLGAARMTVVVLPEPDVTVEATENEHGGHQWWIPAGVVHVLDSGVIETAFTRYRGTDVGRVRACAEGLLAAAAEVGRETDG